MLTVGPRNRRLIPECRPGFVHSAQGFIHSVEFLATSAESYWALLRLHSRLPASTPICLAVRKRCSLWDEIWLESATKLVSSLAARSPRPWLALCGGDPSTPSHLHVLKFESCCFPRNKTLPGSGVGDYTANAAAGTPLEQISNEKGGPEGLPDPW